MGRWVGQEGRARRDFLKTQGRGAQAAEQGSTVDRVWPVGWEPKRSFTLERGWLLGRAGGQRVGMWARQDWKGTNGKLLGGVGWSSANKPLQSVEAACVFLYIVAQLKGPPFPCFLAVLILVTQLLTPEGSWTAPRCSTSAGHTVTSV